MSEVNNKVHSLLLVQIDLIYTIKSRYDDSFEVWLLFSYASGLKKSQEQKQRNELAAQSQMIL